jgi:hypothetical protein
MRWAPKRGMWASWVELENHSDSSGVRILTTIMETIVERKSLRFEYSS